MVPAARAPRRWGGSPPAVCALLALAVLRAACFEPVPEYPPPGPGEVAYRLVFTEEMGVVVGTALGEAGEQFLMEYPIPDYEGQVATPKGTLEYSFTDFAVSSAVIKSPQFETDPDTQTIRAHFANTSMSMGFNYEYRKVVPPIKEGAGRGTLDVFQLDVSAEVHLGHDPTDGGVVIDVISAVGVLSDFNLFLSGSELAWIINAFVSIFKDEITKEISQSLTSILMEGLLSVTQCLHDNGYSFCSDHDICRDARWTDDPIVGSNFVATQEPGQFFVGSAPGEEIDLEGFPPLPAIVNEAHHQQIYGVTGLQSYLEALVKAGKFPTAVYDWSVFGDILSCDSMEQALPGWGQMYHNMGARVEWSTVSSGGVKIYPASAIFIFETEMTITPTDSHGPAGEGPALRANVELWLSAKLDYMNYHGQPQSALVTTSVRYGTFEVEFDDALFELTVSALPEADLDAADFYEWFQELFESVIEPAYYVPVFELNALKLAHLLNCSIANRTIVYNANYIMIGGDVQGCL